MKGEIFKKNKQNPGSRKVFRQIEETSSPYLPQGGASNREQLGKASNRKRRVKRGPGVGRKQMYKVKFPKFAGTVP